MGAFTTSSNPSNVNIGAPQTGSNPNAPVVSYGSQPQAKGGAMPQYGSPNSTQPAGTGGSTVTFPSQSGQPEMGAPNKYANTVQPINNTNIQPVMGAMKGKGS